MELNLKDVRAEMPNYQVYQDWRRSGDIFGIAIHHSATADHTTGAPIGDAYTFFDYHVNTRGWVHGGYNYVITGEGLIQYALDDQISAYHAGFKDPDNSEALEFGQFWNNHYLAICLSGWFSDNRFYRDAGGREHMIPNNFTVPLEVQMESLLALIHHLRQTYNIPVENVRAHRELAGNSTVCPGHNIDPAQLRAAVRLAEESALPDPVFPNGSQPEVDPGQHVLVLPDTDKYLNAAMAYIWKFQPDVTFAAEEVQNRWPYVTVVGTSEYVSDNLLAQLRRSGAKLVQRITGAPEQVQTTFDELVEANRRFLPASEPVSPTPDPQPAPEETWQTYTIQPGDTLSSVARQLYGQAGLWRIIFEANRDTLTDPSRVYPGQVIKIPPKPDE